MAKGESEKVILNVCNFLKIFFISHDETLQTLMHFLYLFFIVTASARTEWSDTTIDLLLARYEDLQESYDNGKLTNRKLFDMISKEMREHHYPFSGTQCSDKMENLKKKHKNIKDWNNVSGNSKKTWIHYDVRIFYKITQI